MMQRILVSLLVFMLSVTVLAFAQTKVSSAELPGERDHGEATVSKTISWNAVTTCADGSPCEPHAYYIYREINGVEFPNRLAEVAPPLLMYVDPELPPGRICYSVTAMFNEGESKPSSKTCVAGPSRIDTPAGVKVK